MVIAVVVDVEKAYDLIWKEGFLIKLRFLGIESRTFNWVMDLLFNRKIQVKVGDEYSKVYRVENGTPQGSVWSPLLFNIMINDIFSQGIQNVKKSLYADDGAIWMQGRNLSYVNKKMQVAINEVEKWASKWGLKLDETQAICFSRHKKNLNYLKIIWATFGTS